MRTKLMAAQSLYLCCAVILLFFSIGHTVGFLLYVPSQAPGKLVLHLMQTTRLVEGEYTFTYYDFYVGFGLLISTYLLFMAGLAFTIAAMLRRSAPVPATLCWLFVVVQALTLILSYRYFAFPPTVMSLALTIISLFAAVQSRREGLRAGPGLPRADSVQPNVNSFP